MAEREHRRTWVERLPAPSPLARQNQLLAQALDVVQRGDLDAAQSLLDSSSDGSSLTLGQVLRLYHTELETQAEQLRDSQLRTEQTLDWFANLFRTLPVAAMLVDMHGRIVDANALAMDELQLADALRTLPIPLRRLMASAEGELRLAALLSRAAPGTTLSLDDVALRTLQGQPRWADLRITQAPPRDGDALAGREGPLFLCVLNDRTARVEALRAREAAAAAEHQRDVAQSASQAKTQLLSRVSHELRTPLNAVIGFSHLLMLDPDRLDTASRRQVQHISDAGQHLLALVDEVLQINQTEAGLLALDLQPVWLAAVARQVLALAQPLALPMALTLELADGGGGDPLDGPQALADPRRVREVLTNLVSNAIKYNRPDGQVRLTLGNDAQWAWIEIHDTGIGMSLAQQAHLFEPFNRLGAEQLKISGNGLGLSIARTLVHAMGGEMRVYSTPGEGSGFRVILPRWAAPLAANPDIGC